MHRAACAVLVMLAAAACGRTNDITRRDDRVDAWVEQERKAEAARLERAKTQQAQHPSAAPQRQPPPPQPAGARPAPAAPKSQASTPDPDTKQDGPVEQ